MSLESVRDPGAMADFIGRWIAEHVFAAGARGIVVGLSGGVDSAVVAALGKRVFGDAMLALILPCGSDPRDAQDARAVAEHLEIPCRTLDLLPAFDRLTGELETLVPLSAMARANLKARLRMTTLYGAAQSLGFLVCGTSNKAEREVGYFTKFGDSASDLLPLAGLLKREVRALAACLGVPGHIVAKPPTAGLWPGQTDELEMGFGYDELDHYLTTGQANPATREKIERMRKNSGHKRLPVPICIPEDGGA